MTGSDPNSHPGSGPKLNPDSGIDLDLDLNLNFDLDLYLYLVLDLDPDQGFGVRPRLCP